MWSNLFLQKKNFLSLRVNLRIENLLLEKTTSYGAINMNMNKELKGINKIWKKNQIQTKIMLSVKLPHLNINFWSYQPF